MGSMSPSVGLQLLLWPLEQLGEKSPFIMQVMADVLNMPIQVAASEQACALGFAMAAAAAGLNPDMGAALRAMDSGFETVYTADPANAEKFRALYRRYRKICRFIKEEFAEKTAARGRRRSRAQHCLAGSGPLWVSTAAMSPPPAWSSPG